ncbi:hypothetical protein Tco_0278969, partial [Tanacetum coccineum]
PHKFCGTKGVVGLAWWFKKMESLFHISNCATNCQVKFSTCTLSDSALRWWNSHVKKVRIEMSWKELMKMMMLLVIFNVFKSWLCYALIMVSDEEKKIERYIWGLPDNIQGNVTSS